MKKLCGAKRRNGELCRKSPCKGKDRCRLHGGCSTGPRTPEGIQRLIEANTIHGRRSKAAIEERKRIKDMLKEADDVIARFA